MCLSKLKLNSKLKWTSLKRTHSSKSQPPQNPPLKTLARSTTSNASSTPSSHPWTKRWPALSAVKNRTTYAATLFTLRRRNVSWKPWSPNWTNATRKNLWKTRSFTVSKSRWRTNSTSPSSKSEKTQIWRQKSQRQKEKTKLRGPKTSTSAGNLSITRSKFRYYSARWLASKTRTLSWKEKRNRERKQK